MKGKILNILEVVAKPLKIMIRENVLMKDINVTPCIEYNYSN